MSNEELKNKAKRALLDGKYKKALEFFEALHKENPNDLRDHVKLAELREKTGDTAGAIKDYIVIANAYAEQGFVVQAIAINKIILRLDSSKTEVKERLKALSSERGDDWAITTVTPADHLGQKDVSGKDRAKLSFERTPLLSGLSGDELESFMDSLELREVAAGDYIFKSGDAGDYLYLIGMGSVGMEAPLASGKKRVFSRLTEGDFFGELAFMARTTHHDQAIAESDTSVLMIDRATFDGWVEKHPAIQSTVEDFYRRRVLARVLAITPVFEGVPPEARMALADKFRLQTYESGSVVVKEGESGNIFYLIRSGHVKISTRGMRNQGDPVELGSMGEGSFFGEVSLLTDKPRTATVTADGALELMELTRDDFKTIVADFPSVLKVVEAYQKQRVQDTIKTLMRNKG
ncbi:MAG TPA: cyclic nucleotide-binding domain-containing protein [Mariprofundaceae bacterium]|nr:cyclic nucleotide-binding domain-containing protein [Mariprofundaceae bacterium]